MRYTLSRVFLTNLLCFVATLKEKSKQFNPRKVSAFMLVRVGDSREFHSLF